MSNIAILGHATRGREVIELLEMLGGKNIHNYNGTFNECYVIDNGKICTCYTRVALIDGFVVITLEEYLEKFPYKVGGKVTYDGDKANIVGMVWDNDVNDVFYEIQVCDDVFKCPKVLLQPYKETMEERRYKELRMPLDDDDKLATEATIDGNKILPPNGYLIGKITQVDNGMLVEYVKKQPEYPKTYEECCKIVNASPYVNLVYNISDGHKYSYDEDNLQLYENIRRLKICRDAYWKIAGEEMGLGGPWTPELHEGFCYTARVINDELLQDAIHFPIFDFLSFPTEEVLREFVENFADIMIQTNKLLR